MSYPPYSPYTRPPPCPPSPFQPPTPAYSQPPTPDYSSLCSPYSHPPPSPMPAYTHPPPSPYTRPQTPYSMPFSPFSSRSASPCPPSPCSQPPPSPMPAFKFPPPSPYLMPQSPYSIPHVPFSPPPPSPPPPSTSQCDCLPTTVANTNNLIYCTSKSDDSAVKKEKSNMKHKLRSDARTHPYRKSSENAENSSLVLREDQEPLPLLPQEILDSYLEVPAPVDVKPFLPSIINPATSVPNHVMNTAYNVNLTNLEPMWNRQQPSHCPVQRNLPKREIVLDGVDIGVRYGRNKFSALGVEKTVKWFASKGFKVCFRPCHHLVFVFVS